MIEKNFPVSTSVVDKVPSHQLPREIVVRVGFKRVLSDFLGGLFVLVLINLAAIIYLRHYTSNFGYWTIRQKWELLANLQEPVDWLILGDSSCNQGVKPEVMESMQGIRAVNLCTIGNITALGDLWMLEEYIQKFGPPERVVIIHVYDMWYRGFNPYLLGQVPRPWGFWNKLTLSTEFVFDAKLLFHLFLERFVPLDSQSRTLGKTIKDLIFIGRNPFSQPWQLDGDGFLPATPAYPDIVEAGRLQHLEFVRENYFFLSYHNQLALDEIIRLSDQYQFTVYLVNSPVYERLFQENDFQVYLSGLYAALADYANRSPQVIFIPGAKTFPADQMQTPDHLIESAAEIYTRWLVNVIQSNPAP